MPLLALLGHAAREALFYVLAAGWYLLCVQWDVVDVLLGGPDLNRRHAGSRREREVEAAGLEAALSWSKSATERPGQPTNGSPAPETVAAQAAAQVDGLDACQGVEDAALDDCSVAADALASGGDGGCFADCSPEAAAPSSVRRRRSSLSRFGSRGSTIFEADGDGRSLYGRLKRKLPAKERLNVKARVERRIAEYSSQLIPDFAAAVGVEAAAGTLAAALPGGVRDAGVRMVDRAEAAVRRWALFIGGVGLLFRLLLWH